MVFGFSISLARPKVGSHWGRAADGVFGSHWQTGCTVAVAATLVGFAAVGEGTAGAWDGRAEVGNSFVARAQVSMCIPMFSQDVEGQLAFSRTRTWSQSATRR